MRLWGIVLLLVVLLLLLLLLQLSCDAAVFVDGSFGADAEGKLDVCVASWLL